MELTMSRDFRTLSGLLLTLVVLAAFLPGILAIDRRKSGRKKYKHSYSARMNQLISLALLIIIIAVLGNSQYTRE
ncbi:hypothetical protein H1S01_00400 [Heliobacterium chlorum]|uniref:HIG1 domain-containing protein n=1 Tax=Heliobacterium chlorum TaxID=2698 RepID=A0ABR7SZ38_HELCL|nr:hypothetical protein [Heliobacterium chlorum]MBC9782965.1 hypothetical protein [Heliobacterium chlorum]